MYLQLGRPAIRGNFLVDITVRAAQDALGNQYQGRREEIVPFFASGRVTRDLYRKCSVGKKCPALRRRLQRLVPRTRLVVAAPRVEAPHDDDGVSRCFHRHRANRFRQNRR